VSRVATQAEAEEPLSKERMLRAAVELADREGIGSLTMRKLARELGAGAMSLYYYVANKDDLLDAMVDVVYGEIDAPSAGEDWKAALRPVWISAREALLRHRWAVALMESRKKPGPANLRHHEFVVGRLREAGFSTERAVLAFSTLDSYVFGFVLQELTLPFQGPQELAEVGESMLEDFLVNEYPHLAETMVELMGAGFRFADQFEVGLDLILDGLAGIRDAA
jgi:AcrR family transcriptional regulator